MGSPVPTNPAPTNSAPRAAALRWQPSRPGARTTPHTGERDLGWFAKRLQHAEILDSGTISLPGATILLPYGVALARRLGSIVRRAYRARGYEEFEYPELGPAGLYTPSRHITRLDDQLLRVGADRDWDSGKPYAVLTPTGEATVYTHWSRLVRGRHDVPLRMFRQAKYFRPAPRGRRSGRSIFRPVEAADVYEFQSCFAGNGDARAEVETMTETIEEICAAVHLPLLWSRRPTWTNRGEISRQTFGGDIALPTGGTVQVACLYDQGQIFSRHYNVGWREKGISHHTYHVTGCVTRRLLLCSLLYGLDRAGNLAIHPELAPVQVAISSTGAPAETQALGERLSAAGIRVTSALTPDRRQTTRFHDAWQRKGAPVRICLQAPRDDDDDFRVILARADTVMEAVVRVRELGHLDGLIADVLEEVGRRLAETNRTTSEHRIVEVSEVSGESRVPGVPGVTGESEVPEAEGTSLLEQVLADRKVARIPLQDSERAVTALESRVAGEVLGFQPLDAPTACFVTGEPTRYVAHVSGRI